MVGGFKFTKPVWLCRAFVKYQFSALVFRPNSPITREVSPKCIFHILQKEVLGRMALGSSESRDHSGTWAGHRENKENLNAPKSRNIPLNVRPLRSIYPPC